MILHPAQSQIAKDRHRFRVVNAGRRFGKTELAVEEIAGKAVFKKDRNIAYIAPTYQQARDIAWGALKKKLEPVTVGAPNESRLEINVKTVDGGQSKIVLRGWEAVETLRGQRFDFIVIDEIAMMRNFWVGWNEVLSPTLIDTKGDALFISTPKGFNHFFDLFNLQDKDPDFKSFKFTTYDNPYIPREEIEREKATKPESSFAQEYLADFRKMEGLVYKEFDRTKHVFTELPQTSWLETIAGLDFGYTNPFALLVIKKDFDNNYWVVLERYATQKTNAEIIEICKQLGNINQFYPDPAEPDRIEEMKRSGLNVREVSKDVEAGIDRVREMFKTNKLKIHSSCTNLIAELETYRYKDKKENQNEPEEPVKENDHACDALRYAIYSNQPTPLVDSTDYNIYGKWSFK